MNAIHQIISGGQTGVDRAALDTAIALEIPHTGWCPLGRKAEDGKISLIYNLVETKSSNYAIRTKLNVHDSDGTLIISPVPLYGGTKLTLSIIQSFEKPFYLIDPRKEYSKDDFNLWVCNNNISKLNTAGPRESKFKGTYDTARKILADLLT